MQFVAKAAQKFPNLQRLNQFLNYQTQKEELEPKIKRLRFHEDAYPDKCVDITQDELEDDILRNDGCQLYIIQSISPGIAALLGGAWDIDPQLFLDHLDDAPWWRLRDVGRHVVSLPASHLCVSDHIHFSFLSPRDFHHENPNIEPVKVPMGLEHVKLASGIRKIAGGLNPVPRGNERMNPVALVRCSAALWISPSSVSNKWTRGKYICPRTQA
jgi:hypothetical protein